MLGRLVVASFTVALLTVPAAVGTASAQGTSSCPSKAPQSTGASNARCMTASTTVEIQSPGTPARSLDVELAVADLDGDGVADSATLFFLDTPTQRTLCARGLSSKEYRASFFDVFTEVSIDAQPSPNSACNARITWTVDSSPPTAERPEVSVDPTSTAGFAINEQGVKSPASVQGSFGDGRTTVDIAQGTEGYVKKQYTGHVTLLR